MTIEEILKALEGFQRMSEGISGVVNDPERKAHYAERAKALREAIALLRTHPDVQPNDPLTLEELRGMGGKPVWCEELQCWGIVKYETVGAWKNKPFLAGVWQNPDFETAVSFEYDIKSRGLTLYRRPPKGENE